MKHKNLYLACLLVASALTAFGGGVKEPELERAKTDVVVKVDVQEKESPILAELGLIRWFRGRKRKTSTT